MAVNGRWGKLSRLAKHPERLRPLYDEFVLALPEPAYQGFRRLAHALPESAARRLGAVAPVEQITSLDEMDERLQRAEVLLGTSEDEGRAFLASFELAPPPLPSDPYSEEYRTAQWDLYRRVSGLDDYTLANEHTPVDLDKFLAQPFPYCTGSSLVVGDQLIAYGYIIKKLNLTPPARVVEFGAGWGHVTMALATMGVDVTVVEIGEDFVEYLERQTAHLPNVEIVHGDMLTFSPSEPYDAALFFESFHHCSDHLELLRRLHDIVKPSGQVMFAAEPIDHFPFPWGLRLDGMSLWSTRRYGWLELGFDSAYFVDALARQGWLSHTHRVRAASPLAHVVVARPDTGER